MLMMKVIWEPMQILLDLVRKIVYLIVESCSHRLRVELPNHATES